MTQIDDMSAQIEILSGLNAPQKYLSPKFFYDKKGAELFEKITCLSEYYLTRTERSILTDKAHKISQYIEPESVIIEPGAGNCEKIRLLLSAISPKAYIPQDVSSEMLLKSAAEIEAAFPTIDVVPVIGDFFKPIAIPAYLMDDPKYVFYPGSTIGNFSREQAVEFLKRMRELIGDKGGLILGADLHKDSKILEAAYNDAEGVTAQFNLNILNNINQLLGSEIDMHTFSHKAFYNETERRIEMHLISQINQSYEILSSEIQFKAGETIHTENSHKYSREDLENMGREAGLILKQFWVDRDELFSMSMFEPYKV